VFSYRQASARPQCSCSCHNQHQQVGYDSGLSSILHNDLHRLDVTERIQFRVAATVYKCLHSMAPAYLTELCSPIAASTSRHGMLRSATTSNLVIPRCRPSTYGATAPVPSVSLVQSAGMLYQIVWSHQTFHLIVSDTSWKHFYFVDTWPSTISTTSAH